MKTSNPADPPPARSATLECQSFPEGCCGCCVNMRWPPARVRAYLAANTQAFHQHLPPGGRPGFWALVRHHARRGGWKDHLLVMLLGPLTLGAAAWYWLRQEGSCCFAGYIDPAAGRAGCLIHPARYGSPDLRRHAFPLIPALGCNRALRCPMLEAADAPVAGDLLQVSRCGYASLHSGTLPQTAVSDHTPNGV